MDFRFKSALQSVFSALPQGHRLNFLFQRHLTRSYPCTDDVFKIKVNQALMHHENYQRLNGLVSPAGKYYEFGAGWDLIIPITMKALDMEVHCIDLRELAMPDLINDSLQKFQAYGDQWSFNRLETTTFEKGDTLDGKLGIHYNAPVDARNTSFDADYFDFMSSTSTLEHIPPDDIESILRECYRILAPGGVLSLLIDYQDHWSYFDQSISAYNFLKYDQKQWKRLNPELNYQNRLRHSQYISLIARTEFEIVKEIAHPPSPKEADALDRLTVHSDFGALSKEDLLVSGSEIVLRKPND